MDKKTLLNIGLISIALFAGGYIFARRNSYDSI